MYHCGTLDAQTATWEPALTYIPKYFFTHAASLHQGFPHCAIFPTAASRSNQVVINHGFGYKTRYAHLKNIGVVEGMKVKRGECIGESGNSGRSSGPHLHYEVMYKDNYVNPSNYYDLTITPEEYATMVQNTADMSEKLTLHPSHRKKRSRS